MNLRRQGGRPLVIAHRGASSEAPENSLAAVAAAIEAQVDLVEFDVSPGLVVAHDPGDEGPHLDEVLALLAPTNVGAHVDVKTAGYEAAVVEAIVRHGLEDRALVSTAFAPVARRLRAEPPGLPVAIGYPRDRLGVSRFSWPEALTRSGAAALRAAMPLRVPLLLAAARADVLALHHALCSGAAIRAAHRRGAPVLAWPVNDPEEALHLAALGVDAVVSDNGKTVLATLLGP